jgi:hypothetical protein
MKLQLESQLRIKTISLMMTQSYESLRASSNLARSRNPGKYKGNGWVMRN